MSSRILFDGRNVGLKSGTGIATYTRNTARIAHDLGHHVALFQSLPDVAPRDPTLRQTLLFEQERRSLTKRERRANWVRARLPGLARLPLLPATPDGTVVLEPIREALPVFDDLYVGKQVFERGNARFAASGRLSPLAPPQRVDLAHFTSALPLRVPGSVNIYTIHDLVPLRLSYASLERRELFLRLHREIAARADHIVTVSEHSRQDIIDLLAVDPSRITNTYQSVAIAPELAGRSEDVVAAEIAGLYGLEHRRYLLFYGAIEPKKNVRRLLEAYLTSGITMPLVLVSSGGWQNEIELGMIAVNRNAGRKDGPSLLHLPYAPYHHLVSLIQGARAVAFPSIYEGFGLPVLEAMALGTPVLTAKTSSLGEIAGDAAVTVDPVNIGAIRTGLQDLAGDDDLCRALSDRGRVRAEAFSPARYQARVAELYGRLGIGGAPPD